MIDPRSFGAAVTFCSSSMKGCTPVRLLPAEVVFLPWLLALILLALSPSASAEKIDDLWPLVDRSDSPSNLQSDRRFVDSMVEMAGSPQNAARQLMDKGWEYIRKRDTTRALRRFNQAFLLEPASAEAHWGLGTVASQLGRPVASLRLLEKAHALQGKKDVALLTDIGFAHIQLAVSKHDNKAEAARELKLAQEWLNRAESVDARFALVWANRAIIHYYQGEFLVAWQNVERAEALDKSGIDPLIVRELSARMPRPGSSERVAVADGIRSVLP